MPPKLFFEIPVTDFFRAVDFYEAVLNVKLPIFECGQEKMACFNEDGVTIGAISQSPDLLADFMPSEKGVLIHFNTDDIAGTLQRVEQKGGKVVIPRKKIEAECGGYFAVFADSEGNRIGIYADN